MEPNILDALTADILEIKGIGMATVEPVKGNNWANVQIWPNEECQEEYVINQSCVLQIKYAVRLRFHFLWPEKVGK